MVNIIRKRKGVSSASIGCFLILVFTIHGVSYGDSAQVLPKGVFSASLSSNIYFPIDKRYDPDGNVEDVAANFNTTLDSSVFPALAPFEGPPFNLSSASVGDSVVSFEYDVIYVNLGFAYGITDRLTVGIKIPYKRMKNNVDARVDTTNATVGKNPLFGTPGDPFGVPLIPISVGGVPLKDDDVQDLLGGGLDVDGDGTVDIPGFGFKRFETWSAGGLQDIDVGAKYQYFKNERWRMALTGGVRLPTGDVDDPDNLVDRGFGTGAWALFIHSNNDYTGIKNLLLNGTARYSLYLPNRETLRVSDDVDEPLTTNVEKVDRDLGDVIELEALAKYEFLRGANFSLLYHFGYSFRDDVSGDLGFNYQSLEDETEWTEHVIKVYLSYSTVPLFLEKKFPIPISVFIGYRNRFAGKNNVFKSEYISLGVSSYF